MWQLILPHFGLGLGLGVVDSSLMPLLAKLVEDRHVGAYGSVFAVSQTAVSLAYGIGPLCGGALAEHLGFPTVIRGLGIINILYSPMLLYLAKTNNQGSPQVRFIVIVNAGITKEFLI
jgi:DHA1 family solute carrier family 18 vesicular amine transporter 1/2